MMRAIGLIAIALWACPTLAAEVLPAPRAVDAASFKAFVGQGLQITDGMGTHTLRPDGRYDSMEAGASNFKARWKVTAGNVVVQGMYSTAMCGGEDCGPPRKLTREWKGARLAGERLLILPAGAMSVSFFECRPATDKDEPGLTRVCDPAGSVVQVLSGHRDTQLFQQVREALARDKNISFFVEGPAAKNPRATSELWFWKAYPEDEEGKTLTEALAKSLEPLLGPVTPREWTWGGPYPGILIVGQARAQAGQ